MATVSARSIRIRHIDEAFTLESLRALYVQQGGVGTEQSVLSYFSRWLPYTSRPALSCLGSSLSVQNGYKVATASFNDENAKRSAAKYAYPAGWIVDDKFDGITILHSPTTEHGIEVDICAIHGPQGNAFDTWEAGNETRTSMWLRDYLPYTPPFNRARIMTFGYSSQVKDRENVSEIRDWAKNLLSQVGSVRKQETERKRPIIFVCHSLGGIVARDAIVRLNAHPEEYPCIRIQDCGLLFLGTPHSGTTLAEWNAFLSSIAAVAGVRTEVIEKLRSFNSAGVDSKEAFNSIKIHPPPYYCFSETKRLNIGGKLTLVVIQDSAGLNGAVAEPIPDSDHRQMCRYEHIFAPGYGLVVEGLEKIQGKLLLKPKSARSEEEFEELPGHPLVTAARFPLPSGKAYYEGKGLFGRGGDRLVGRAAEYDELRRVTSEMLDETTEITAISVSGIGGIGKTELLLTLAHRYRNKSNIFLLRPSVERSFTEALLSIANNIGSELLATRHRNQDLHRLWSDLDVSQKIEAFHGWFSAEESGKNFLLIDDIDAVPQSEIKAALPQGPRNILITTRNPILVKALEDEYHLQVHWIRLANLADNDMMEYTSRRFENFLGDGNHPSTYIADHIETVSRLAVGHPLVASRIVSYIATNLTEWHGPKAAEHFVQEVQKAHTLRKLPVKVLKYKPMFQYSIAETFESSRKRLPGPDEPSWTLMQLIAFMVLDDSAYMHFLSLERPWIFEYKGKLHFHDIWFADLDDKQAWLSSLRKVSLGTARSQTEHLHFHPILIQYIQEQTEEKVKIRIIGDIMLLAMESIQRSDQSASTDIMLSAHAKHCTNICKAYGILPAALGLPQSLARKCKLIFDRD